MDSMVELRFLAKVDKGPHPKGCWLWTASYGPFGYGHMRVGNRLLGAHRVSYELYKGPIPRGLHVMHACDIRACVNPEHLSVGTAQENAQDKMRKGRYYNGADKVPPGLLSKIRKLMWENLSPEDREARIAALVGRTRSVPPEIWAQINRENWANQSVEDRKKRVDAVSAALKDKPFTPQHLANLRASPANQKGRPVRFVPPRKLTDEQWSAIAEEFYLGTPSTALAEKYGVSDGIILKVMRKFEVSRIAGYGTGKESLSEKHGNADKVHTDEQKQLHAEKMRELWATGAFANRKPRPKKEKPPKAPVDWSAIRRQMWANMTDEQKAARAAKITASKLGKKLSDEHKEKIRRAHIGMKKGIRLDPESA